MVAISNHKFVCLLSYLWQSLTALRTVLSGFHSFFVRFRRTVAQDKASEENDLFREMNSRRKSISLPIPMGKVCWWYRRSTTRTLAGEHRLLTIWWTECNRRFANTSVGFLLRLPSYTTKTFILGEGRLFALEVLIDMESYSSRKDLTSATATTSIAKITIKSSCSPSQFCLPPIILPRV